MRPRFLAIVVALLACGCGKDADRLSKVFSLAGAKFEVVSGGVRAKLANGVQAARGETGVDSRVSTRLRWDKTMDGADGSRAHGRWSRSTRWHGRQRGTAGARGRTGDGDDGRREGGEKIDDTGNEMKSFSRELLRAPIQRSQKLAAKRYD